MHQTPAKSLQCRRSPDFCVFQVGASVFVLPVEELSLCRVVVGEVAEGDGGTAPHLLGVRQEQLTQHVHRVD